MIPIFGEEAYRLPVGAGRGTVGTVRALRALSVRSSYIIRRLRTGSPNDETPWLPNKEMTKPCEVSDETSTNLFPHF